MPRATLESGGPPASLCCCGLCHLALINTGQYEIDRYREYSRCTAARFGLRYDEIPGSDAQVVKMLHGPWDDDFVVAPPGHTITYLDFRPPGT